MKQARGATRNKKSIKDERGVKFFYDPFLHWASVIWSFLYLTFSIPMFPCPIPFVHIIYLHKSVHKMFYLIGKHHHHHRPSLIIRQTESDFDVQKYRSFLTSLSPSVLYSLNRKEKGA